jgi:hypothetical protein
MGIKSSLPVGAGALGASVAAAAMGFSAGAPEYFAGSPGSGFASCTACHAEFDENSGEGSVAVLDAPLLYVLDETYTLRVRVADPGQAGAGFQAAVEDTQGYPMGQLIIADALRTRSAGGNPDVPFITHTRDGKDSAIANWAANGQAAEWTIRWRAPGADAGEIAVYAAGNAVNNADGLGGDYVYTTAAPMRAAALGDLNGDGAIDTADLGILLVRFGTAEPVADVIDDLIVDVADLALMLSLFGN